MIEIPKNTYSVESDPVVEETIKKCIEKLSTRDAISIDRHPLNDYYRDFAICVDHDSIGYEVAKHFVSAGYHAAVKFFNGNGSVNYFIISKKPIEMEYRIDIIG